MGQLADIRSESDDRQREAVLAALDAAGWVIARAAHILGEHPTQVRRAIERLGIREQVSARNAGPGRPKTTTKA